MNALDKDSRNRRLFTLFAACVITLSEMFVMWIVWKEYYHPKIRIQFVTKGHWFILAIYIVVLFFFMRMYGAFKIDAHRRIELLFSAGIATVCTNVIFYVEICLLAYYFPNPFPAIQGMFLQGILICIWILGSTALFRMLFPPLKVLLIYEGGGAQDFRQKVETRRHQFQIVDSIPASERIEKIFSSIDKYQAVMMWDIPTPVRNKIFKYCYDKSVTTYVMPKISDIILNGSEAIHVFDTPLLLTKSSPLEFEQEISKRGIDIILSFLLIILTSPMMALTALSIKLYDGGAILYKQTRCTLEGKKFQIYKFRSMIANAEEDGIARLAAKGDSRITPIGKIIRKVRIDELPQLFNIIKGEMSFVGPRPERPEIIEKYTEEMPEFSYRVKVKAGLTGYAQIFGKYNTKPYDKLKLDLYYIEHYSVWLDLKLIILTLKILLTLESTEGVAQGLITPTQKENRDEKSKS